MLATGVAVEYMAQPSCCKEPLRTAACALAVFMSVMSLLVWEVRLARLDRVSTYLSPAANSSSSTLALASSVRTSLACFSSLSSSAPSAFLSASSVSSSSWLSDATLASACCTLSRMSTNLPAILSAPSALSWAICWFRLSISLMFRRVCSCMEAILRRAASMFSGSRSSARSSICTSAASSLAAASMAFISLRSLRNPTVMVAVGFCVTIRARVLYHSRVSASAAITLVS